MIVSDSLRSSKGKAKAVQPPARVVAQKQKETRRRTSTSSDDTGSDGGSDSGSDEDQSAMLAALQAHSRALLGFGDGAEEAESSIQAQKRLSRASDEDHTGDEDDDEDEVDDGAEAEEFQSDDGWGAGDDFVTDSEDGVEDTKSPEVVKETVAQSKVPEVVFAPQNNSSMDVLSKAERRAFLVS